MNKAKEQFFSLLRSGLWDSPIADSLFAESVDWEYILAIAKMQTVTGVVFDGISNLSSRLQPPSDVMRKLYQTVIRIEHSHELLNKRLTEIVPKLQLEGIYPVLLKGQGVAQNYPNPIRRQCGDIDLFVGKKDCEKACQVLLRLGAEPENKNKKKSPKHENFYLREVSIELHFLVEKLRNPYYNKRFQPWCGSHLRKENLRSWNLNGINIFLPPVNFDALYIFNHLYHHFISGGIGLRQLCDWAVYLHTFSDQIDKSVLLKDLKVFGLLKPWQLFGCIVVDQLGLPKEDFPFYTEKQKKYSQKILSKILQTGNFGFYNSEHDNHPSGFLSGKFHSLLLKQRYLIEIFPIRPKDVLVFYIEYWTNGIVNIIKRR